MDLGGRWQLAGRARERTPAAPAQMEIGAMDLVHRARQSLAAMYSEHVTIQRLERRDDRSLADLGLTREEIRPVARLATQLGSQGIVLSEIVARVRAEADGSRDAAVAARIAGQGQPQAIAYARGQLARHTANGQFQRVMGMIDGYLALERLLANTDFGKRLTLRRIHRQEYKRVSRELQSYTARELMDDLRMTRSEIPGVATESADLAVARFVRANPAYREAAGWSGHRGGFAHVRG